MIRLCRECGEEIPASRRPAARHCTDRCSNYARWKRWHVGNEEKERERNRVRMRYRYQLATYGTILETPEDIVKYGKDKYRHARALGFRSGLEVKIAKQLDDAGVSYQYEMFKLQYHIPARFSLYTPDFILANGIVCEAKGEFTSQDRKKHKLINAQYPDLDVRILFSNPNQTIGKKSKTTYAQWCDGVGIPWAGREIPQEWIDESPNPKAIKAAKEALGWTYLPPL